MKMQIFSVYDSAAQCWGQPHYALNVGTCLRSWQEAVNDGQSPFSKHPKDFTLFHIGEFDDIECSVSMHQAKIPLGTALEHQRKSPLNNLNLAPQEA